MFEDITKKLDHHVTYQRIAASTVFAEHKPRIFEKGEAADGTKIGEYVDGPYKQKRLVKGREVDFVNLEMTGAMKKDYQLTARGSEIVGFGFSNQTELDKAEYNETRYGKKIFELSQSEADLYMEKFTALIFGDQ